MESENASAKGGKTKILIISLVVLVGLVIILAVGKSMTSQLSSKSSFQSGGATMESGLAPSSATQSFTNPLPSNSVGSDYKAETVQSEAADVQNIQNTDKKVIKNGNLNLKVSKVDDATKDITQIAKDNGGDIFSSNFYQTANNIKSGTITLKVPNNNFEKTFS
jgi:hypothetical protein